MTVEWMDELELAGASDSSRTSLRASYDAVVRACGDRLTEERKAELKKFYEIED